MSRTVTGLSSLIVLGLWVFSALYFEQLPERIPTHFGIDGTADAWSDRSLVGWFLIPGIALVSQLGMMGLTGWLSRHPEQVNVPGARRVRDIPDRFRGPIVDVVRQMMAMLQLELAVLFALIQRSTWVGAFGGDTRGLMFAVLALALLSSPFAIAWVMIRMKSAVDQAVRRARAEGVEPG